MSLPIDALGIGCRRCASSFFHDYLNSHPDVVKPERGLHYFSENYERGNSWYLSMIPEKKNNQISIEFSVSYSYPEFAEEAAERISKTYPNIKIFSTIRNPIDRVYSDYLRSVRFLEIAKATTFEEYIKSTPETLERGNYKKILEPYFNKFNKGNIHIIFFDDINSSSTEYLSEFINFLGLKDHPLPPRKKKKSNEMIKSTSFQYNLVKNKKRLDHIAKTIKMSKIWNILKKKLIRLYIFLLKSSEYEQEMNSETRIMLQKYYAEDIIWLSKITDKNLDHWK